MELLKRHYKATEGVFSMQQIENNVNEVARDLSDAPVAATKKAIKEWLIEKGARGIISTNALAVIIGCSRRVIKDAENANQFKILDKCTYDLDSVVDWLMKNPRYVAQQKKYYEVTEVTYQNVKEILLRNSKTLIRLWNDDVDDLTAEVCYRISKKTMGATRVSEKTVIINVINSLWREKQTQQMAKTVSLDAIRANGGQI